MRISTQTELLNARFPMEKTIRMLATAGFDCIDYSMFSMKADDNHPMLRDDYKQTIACYRDCAAANGVCFNQAHAPFPGFLSAPKENHPDPDVYNKMMLPRMHRAVEAAGRLGCSQIVVHPIAFTGERERQLEWNLATYRELGKTAKDFGTRIGIENMWGRSKAKTIIPNVASYGEDLAEMYDLLNDPDIFTVNLDVGHSGLVGDDAGHAIRVLGHRLGSLHIHDNDHVGDLHTIPFLGKLDWEDITNALKEVGYKGDFTLEADNFIKKMPEACLPTALKLMAEVARYLADKSE